MLQRLCRVLRVDADGVWLLPESGSCAGCVGCGGRCTLLPTAEGAFCLPQAQVDGELSAGTAAVLALDEAALVRHSLWAYGLPLLGLLGGAALGAVLAWLTDLPLNPATAIAAAAGTLLGLRPSKRHAVWSCRVRAR